MKKKRGILKEIKVYIKMVFVIVFGLKIRF
jgi:hypothetical protein